MFLYLAFAVLILLPHNICREEVDIVCNDYQECTIGNRFIVNIDEITRRDAGDISGHPEIKLGHGGWAKFVGAAHDLQNNQRIFIKCHPGAGGQGTVHGVRQWRGGEVEVAANGSPNLLTRAHRIELIGGGTCDIYPWADTSLTNLLESHRPLVEIERVLLGVLLGIEALHSLGFVHRDIKHPNVLRAQGEWKLADFDASARTGELVTELMG
mmetsp:Transcript_9162/g.26388  ORF Transcript_9162/g.26388 Transcript_9162/m.26388 type:complete len:212 (+) Transcript_9162:16-651(+)